MKDAILKGTGDSRYLKSKIPTGTTWEQALAMLNAGTFPVDLNGINSEGFQQLGTPLNKANLLKDAVSSKLGLVGDKTPNDMFGVLADCGNLHVWRKTVVTTEEVPAVPAGYTLGNVETNVVLAGINGSNSECSMRVISGDAITVANDGTVTITGNTKDNQYGLNLNGIKYPDYMSGRFVSITYYVSHPPSMYIIDGVWFIPSDATVTHHYGDGTTYGYEFVASQARKVNTTAYTPAIPAGTSSTYPVSTNRNAYQEGNNAKPAGYVLGDVVSGSFAMATNGEDAYTNVSNVSTFAYSDSVTVNNDGVVSISGTDSEAIGGPWEHFLASDIAAFQTLFRGKYLKLTSRTGKNVSYGITPFATAPSGVVFIPNDAVFSAVTQSDGVVTLSVDRYQPVTGYPAVPAGTTIEYLGCLGDKIRVHVLDYVGTGTTTTTLTFDFTPKIMAFADVYSTNKKLNNCKLAIGIVVDGKYTTMNLGSQDYLVVSVDGNKVTFYDGYSSNYYTFNESGQSCRAIAIG